MTSRQSRLRERRKAEGCTRLDVILTQDAAAALERVKGIYKPGLTQSELVEFCIMGHLRNMTRF